MTSTAVAPIEPNPVSLTDQLLENLGGMTLSQSDLTRVKFPSGGATFWSVPGIGGENPEKALEGTILAAQTNRIFWDPASKANEGAKGPPFCKSDDGKTGHAADNDAARGAHVGGDCATCWANQWRSKGNGKACQERPLIYFLRPGVELLPIVISIPVGSLKVFNGFRVSMVNNRKSLNNIVVNFALRKEENKAGTVFSQLVCTYVRDLNPQEQAEIGAYRKAFLDLLPRWSSAGMTDDEFESPPAAPTSSKESYDEANPQF